MKTEQLDWFWSSKLGILVADCVIGASASMFFYKFNISTYKDRITELHYDLNNAKSTLNELNNKTEARISKETEFIKEAK